MPPARKPKGRTLAEFEPLQPAEKTLLDACERGEVAHIADSRPEAAHENNTVRAGFLRFLALGGDGQAPVHERGVRLQGAWITDTLDLASASVSSDLRMAHCQFSETPLFTGTNIAGSLDFTGSLLPGVTGQGMTVSGNFICNNATFYDKGGLFALMADSAVIKGAVFLTKVCATGEVRLVGAQIGGNLECNDAKFDGKETYALTVDDAVVKGNVFLTNARATGEVHLSSAQIGGNLECIDAKFDGKGDIALVADGMTINNVFFFRNTSVSGKISLAGVHVDWLVDDINSWGKCVILDGLTYDSIAGGAPTNATTRLAWLDRQSPEHAGLSGHGFDFKPQPWRQLAKDMCPQRSWIYRKTSRILHWWFGALTGYGYRPLRLLSWVLGVWLFCAAIYWGAALEGGYAPSSPPVFQNPAYTVCEPPKNNWYLCSQLSEAYSGFSPLAYSLDIILPFVDLQQETRWSPLIPTPIHPWYAEFFANWSWQHNIRLLVWFETLFGWLSGLLLAAVVSGLAKRREE